MYSKICCKLNMGSDQEIVFTGEDFNPISGFRRFYFRFHEHFVYTRETSTPGTAFNPGIVCTQGTPGIVSNSAG